MTNEQVEAARQAIKAAWWKNSLDDVRRATTALDALCAAARPASEENLMGKRVKVNGRIGTITRQREKFGIEFDPGEYFGGFVREHFELMEDDEPVIP